MYEDMEEQEKAIENFIREISMYEVEKQCENIEQFLTLDQRKILEKIKDGMNRRKMT